MKLTITRPEDFEYGVWTIVAELDPHEKKVVGKGPLVFELPDLQERLFRVETDYSLVAPKGNISLCWGKFIDSRWEGVIQANGVSEDACATNIEQVRIALFESMNRAIGLFRFQ
jgi:hypothetical protein